MDYYLVPKSDIEKLKIVERNLRKCIDTGSLEKAELALEVLNRIANESYWTATYHPTIGIEEL